MAAFDGSPSRLRGLIAPALRQGASVVLLCDTSADHLPDEVEVQPVSALQEILQWADFLALDVEHGNCKQLLEKLGEGKRFSAWGATQILVRTPMPCGGIADCGVCAFNTRSEWHLACKDGPVFNLSEL
jgi:hypothetical protein